MATQSDSRMMIKLPRYTPKPKKHEQTQYKIGDKVLLKISSITNRTEEMEVIKISRCWIYCSDVVGNSWKFLSKKPQTPPQAIAINKMNTL